MSAAGGAVAADSQGPGLAALSERVRWLEGEVRRLASRDRSTARKVGQVERRAAKAEGIADRAAAGAMAAVDAARKAQSLADASYSLTQEWCGWDGKSVKGWVGELSLFISSAQEAADEAGEAARGALDERAAQDRRLGEVEGHIGAVARALVALLAGLAERGAGGAHLAALAEALSEALEPFPIHDAAALAVEQGEAAEACACDLGASRPAAHPLHAIHPAADRGPA